MSKKQLANDIIELVGGRDNIKSVTHCMTRLRFTLIDSNQASEESIKRLTGVVGVVTKGGQFQVIIGPDVAQVYNELNINSKASETKSTKPKEKMTFKSVFNAVLSALSASMTPLIPILLCAGFSKTIVAVFGPDLLGWLTETSSTYILFNFVGDAGFYFLPVFAAYTAAKHFETSEVIALLLGAIMIHPTLIQMATDGTAFSVYGIPTTALNYTSTVIPSIMAVYVMSHVENFFKKYTPKTLMVFGIPFGTLLVMLPLTLSILAPMGSFIGTYVGAGLIALYDIAGPLAVGILAGVFGLLVMTGMHPVLFAFLFVTFPTMGYDAFIIPAMILGAWAGAGVTLACIVKFKDKDKKALTVGYFLTWLLGGVGEPMLYGLNVPYRTPMYAGIISGFFAGVIGGFMGLKAYILGTSNGIYGLAAFFGGPSSNLTVLAITVTLSVIIGFITMWFMKLDETLA